MITILPSNNSNPASVLTGLGKSEALQPSIVCKVKDPMMLGMSLGSSVKVMISLVLLQFVREVLSVAVMV